MSDHSCVLLYLIQLADNKMINHSIYDRVSFLMETGRLAFNLNHTAGWLSVGKDVILVADSCPAGHNPSITVTEVQKMLMLRKLHQD